MPANGEESVLVPSSAMPAGSLRIADFPESLRSLLQELDDSGDGILDIEELTGMCKTYVDMKRASAEGCISISSLPREIQPTLKAFDVDGDGSVAPIELARAAELYTESKQRAKKLGKIVAGLSFILILLVFAIVGMTAQVIEMSKETKTSSDGITTVAGSDNPAATAQVQRQSSITEAFMWEPAQLDAVKSLYFPEDETVTCPADAFCERGTELSYTVTVTLLAFPHPCVRERAKHKCHRCCANGVVCW